MMNSGGNLADRVDVPEFRSLSPLAALALLLGLSSPVALVTPLLLIVPVGAALFGLLALTKIRNSDGALTGEGLARWGVALAIASIAATLVRSPVRDAFLRREARQAAEDWIELMVEEQYDEARLLLSSQAVQGLSPKKTPSLDPEPDREGADAATFVREKLRADGVARQLAELKLPLAISATPAAGEWPLFDPPRTLLTEDFTISAGEDAQPLRLEIRLVRSAVYETQGRPWRVDHWQPTDGAESAAPAASL